MAALVLLLAAGSARAQTPQPLDPQCATLLPAPEAEKLTGIKPLTMVGRFQVQYAGGHCNYVRHGKDVVLLVTIERGARAGDLEKYKEQAQYTGEVVKPLPGVGDEAFLAAGVLGFRRGTTIISLSSFFDPQSGKHFLSDGQVAAVAKAIAAKL
jgi:hypothetical protein